jgi:hypothetical protein
MASRSSSIGESESTELRTGGFQVARLVGRHPPIEGAKRPKSEQPGR